MDINKAYYDTTVYLLDNCRRQVQLPEYTNNI